MTIRICIVQPTLNTATETFIKAHAERLPADVTVVHGNTPHIEGTPVLSPRLAARVCRKARRLLTGRSWQWERTLGYVAAFRQCHAEVVLAEYGPTGVGVLEACKIAGLPLVVHFHGYDASETKVLEEFRQPYRQLFRSADAVVCVSTAMRNRLLELGADPERTHLNVYGINCEQFGGALPQAAPPVFLTVGRFTEKKGPEFSIRAFAEVVRQLPLASLRMIGEGQLLDRCKDLVGELGIENAVVFLGAQPHEIVSHEMKRARSFVQHSIEAPNGDCEGTPLAVLEASACGLPVVATRHAGIPDVVVDGETGFVVAEKDVSGMADRMLRLATDSELAGRLGAAARERVSTHFTMEKSIAGLYKILSQAVAENDDDRIRRNGASCPLNV